VADAKLQVVIDAIDRSQRAFSGVAARLDKMKGQLRGAGVALSAFGAAGTLAFAGMIKSAQDQEIGIRQLDQALQNVGTSYDAVKQSVEGTIEALQRKTNFGDEKQREVLTRLIGVLGDEQKALKALPAVLDAAAFSTRDATTVAETMSKFLAGLANTSDAVGVSVDSSATFMERLNVVMGVTAGQAEAAADPMTQMRNRLGDVAQIMGGALLPIVEKVATAVERFARMLQNVNPTILKVIAIVGVAAVAFAAIAGPILILLSLVPAISAGVGVLTVAFGALSVAIWPVTLTVLAIAAAVALGIVIWKKWGEIMDFMRSKWGLLVLALLGPLGALIAFALHWKEIWEGMKSAFSITLDSVRVGLDKFKDFFQDHWKEIATIIATFTLGPLAGLAVAFGTNAFNIRDAMLNLFGIIGDVLGDIGGVLKDFIGGVLDVFKLGWLGMTWTVRALLEAFVDVVTGIIDTIGGPLKSFGADVLDVFETAWDKTIGAIRTLIDAPFNVVVSLGEITQEAFDTAIKAVTDGIAKGYNLTINFATGTLVGLISNIWAWISQGVPTFTLDFLTGTLTGLISNIWAWISQGVPTFTLDFLTGTLTGLISNIWAWIQTNPPSFTIHLIGTASDFLKKVFGWIESGAEIFVNIGGDIKDSINNVLEVMANAIDVAKKGIDKVPGGNPFGDAMIAAASTLRAAKLAEGGDILRGGMSLVGERGPELLRLPTGASVTPTNQINSAMVGVPGPITVNLVIDGHILATVEGILAANEEQVRSS